MTVNEDHTLLHYGITGDGPLVILLHGLLMDGNSWVSNGLVDALRNDFTVVYPDLLAHGKSANFINAAYDRQSQADGIWKLIDGLGVKKAHVVGYSSGAWLAISLAKYHPECLSSLVIGGWDVQNGLPKVPDGRLDFDTFFAFAEETAPALTAWVSAENKPPLRASFEALAGYEGLEDAPLIGNIDIPKLFWAGAEDIYYQPLKDWSENNHQVFLTTQGDHVSAIEELTPETIARIHHFLKEAL